MSKHKEEQPSGEGCGGNAGSSAIRADVRQLVEVKDTGIPRIERADTLRASDFAGGHQSAIAFVKAELAVESFESRPMPCDDPCFGVDVDVRVATGVGEPSLGCRQAHDYQK